MLIKPTEPHVWVHCYNVNYPLENEIMIWREISLKVPYSYECRAEVITRVDTCMAIISTLLQKEKEERKKNEHI